jgi:hypothetical protein
MRLATSVPLVAMVLALVAAPRPVAASTITLGPRIDLSPTTFVVPVNVSGAIAVQSWQFDLTYDASDVQVNAGCDPFSGDVYCSLFTGPVTEGDFFAAGAPFNLLNPGFINLDPVTLAQTGLLFAVNGAFGGFAPFPSGDGTLAFVEFIVLGNGTSPIQVNGSIQTVPEPGAIVLLAAGVLLTVKQRVRQRAVRR